MAMSDDLEHKDGTYRRDSVQENLSGTMWIAPLVGTTTTRKAMK
jgi:hypothetical protein